METKCTCGGEYRYIKPKHVYFSGTYLECSLCKQPPPPGVVVEKKLTLEAVKFVHAKTNFAKIIGVKPQSIDAMIKGGRAKLLKFAKKEFVYYDKE